jgi:hypothetical protein
LKEPKPRRPRTGPIRHDTARRGAIRAAVEALEPRRYMALFLNDIDSENLGKGMWAWTLSSSMTNDGFSTSNFSGWFSYLKNTMHLDYVITKAGNGDSLNSQYTASVVNAAHAAGLKMVPYFYIYGDASDVSPASHHSSAEAAVFNQVFNAGGPGGDFAIFDIESEYGDNDTAGLTNYFNLIGKSQSGNGSGSRDRLFMAYSTFDVLHFHNTQLPVKTIADYCDAAMPQMYWKAHGYTIQQDLDTVDGDYKNTTLLGSAGIKPVIPTGQTYDSGSGLPTAAETNSWYTTIINDPNAVGGTGAPAGWRYKSINYFDEHTTTAALRTEIGAEVIGDKPGIATLSSPANGAVGVAATGTVLNWSDVANTFGASSVGAAMYYDVYLDNMATPAATIAYTAPNAPASQYTIPGTLSPGSHSWKIIARNMQGSGTASSVFTFSVGALTAPTNVSPANGATTNSNVFDWTDVAGATSYDLFIDGGAAINVATSTYTASSLTDGAHSWYVVAKAGASSSPNGATWSFTLDRTAPTAALGSQRPVAGQSTYTFKITYADALSLVDVSTLDNSDVTVQGPGGYDAAAALISVDVNTNGTPRVATYQVAAPGGTWDGVDGGTYYVIQTANQVKDTLGNARAGSTIASFYTDTTLPAPAAPSNPSPNGAVINATPITLDWADSAGATGYNVYLGNTLYAVVSSSQLTGYVPPSDGVVLWSVEATNSDQSTLGPQWSFTLDTTPPTASLPPAQTPTAGQSTFDFTVTYGDATTAVDTVTFDGSDITVTGPGGFTANASFISNTGNTATYRIAAPGGTWDSADNGTYTVSQNAGQVKDTANNARPAGAIGTFDVSATPPFAYMVGSTLNVQFDGTATPILLSTNGSNIVATKGATSLTFSGVVGITGLGTGNDDALQISAPLAPPLTFNNGNGNDSVHVLAGTMTFDSDLSPTLRNVDVMVDSGAAAVFSGTQHLGGLVADGTVTVAQGAGAVLVTKALSGTGRLDLKDNDFVLDYSSVSPVGTWNGSTYDGITGLIRSGRNGGNWGGNGIVSSVANASITTLGVADASTVFGISGAQTHLFGSETVDATSVLVKYTYGGDANLDGKINVDDYTKIDFNVSLASTGWLSGDFNYDGKINVDDYTLIDFNVGLQSGVL